MVKDSDNIYLATDMRKYAGDINLVQNHWVVIIEN